MRNQKHKRQRAEIVVQWKSRKLNNRNLICFFFFFRSSSFFCLTSGWVLSLPTHSYVLLMWVKLVLQWNNGGLYSQNAFAIVTMVYSAISGNQHLCWLSPKQTRRRPRRSRYLECRQQHHSMLFSSILGGGVHHLGSDWSSVWRPGEEDDLGSLTLASTNLVLEVVNGVLTFVLRQFLQEGVVGVVRGGLLNNNLGLLVVQTEDDKLVLLAELQVVKGTQGFVGDGNTAVSNGIIG